jgi:hypothetical protein
MDLRLRWRADRTVTTAAAVGLLSAVAAAAFTSAHADPDGEIRLGCGTYCRSAAPLGVGVGPGRESVTIVPSGGVTLDADDYLPVTLTCDLPVQCSGSLLVDGYSSDGRHFDGRSDLVVDAGATATLAVRLPAALVEYIRAHNPPCPPPSTGPETCPARLGILADVGPSFGCDGKVYWGPTQSGLPPCGQGPVNGFRVLSSATLQVRAA